VPNTSALQLGSGIQPGQVEFTKDQYGDVFLTDGVAGDGITLEGEAGSYGGCVDEVQFADGETLTAAQVVAMAEYIPPPDPGPTAWTDWASADPGQTIDLSTLFASEVSPGRPGDTITICSVSGPDGAVRQASNGDFMYTLPDIAASARFSYVATDQNGMQATASTTISVDDPGPIAGDVIETVGHGQTIDLTPALLGAVTPGLPGDTDSIGWVDGWMTGAMGAVSQASDGDFMYTAPEAADQDNLYYTAEDQIGDQSDAGLVTINVDPGPAVGPASVTTETGQTIDLTPALLGAVTPGLAGDVITIASVNGSAGVVSQASDGDFIYAAPSAAGLDAFTYVATDQFGDEATGAVTIDVEASPPSPPTIAGAIAGQQTRSDAPLCPFAGVTVTDSNAGATDSLDINLDGPGVLSDGVGFSGLAAGQAPGTYSLSGVASAITRELDSLVFTPGAGPANTTNQTSFTLYDASSAGTSVGDSTTTVTNVHPAAAPTLGGSGASVAAQSSTTDDLSIHKSLTLLVQAMAAFGSPASALDSSLFSPAPNDNSLHTAIAAASH
jgi:hypothetical protein